MKGRIKLLRKTLGLSQSEFGLRIGVRQTTIAGYENGIRVPLDAVITSMCREFNVNEEWLKAGKGPMFEIAPEDQELDQVFAEIQLSDDEIIKNIIKGYWRLNEEHKEAIRAIIRGAVEAEKQKNKPME